MDVMLPEVPNTSIESKSNSHADVFLMTQYPGGKERTKQEFMTMATGAGFSGIRYERVIGNFWVMEFYK